MATRGRVSAVGSGNAAFESRLIWAPSPDDRTLALRLFRQPETPDQMGEDARDAALAMYMGHIHGAITYTDLTGKPQARASRGLLDAHALFRGVHRPYIKDGLDGRVYMYVTRPETNFVAPAIRQELRQHIQEVPAPENSVFVTFVLFDDDSIRRWEGEIQQIIGRDPQIDGLIVDWEWTLADADDPTLPDDFCGRYDERMWLP